MRIAIIGYTGFLGQTLTKCALAHGVSVCGMGPHKAEHLPVDYVPFDVIEGEPNFPEGIDGVFYLAQSPYYRDFPNNTRHLFAVNSLGPIAAAAAAAKAGARFFCFASTGNVYTPSFSPMPETALLSRATAYGLSKIMGEEGLALFDGEMTTLSVRLFGLFGPGQNAMLPYFLQKSITEGKEIFLESAPGECTPTGGMLLSFLYAPDCAEILMELLFLATAGKTLPKQVNIAGPKGISIKTFAEMLGEILGRKPIFTLSPKSRNTNFIADISLLNSLVHYDFTPFPKALGQSYSLSTPD